MLNKPYMRKFRAVKIIESILIIALIGLISYAIVTTLPMAAQDVNGLLNDGNFLAHQMNAPDAQQMQVAFITDDLLAYGTQQCLIGLNEGLTNIKVTVYEVGNESVEVDRAFDLALLTECEGIFVKFRQNAIAKTNIQMATEQGIPVVVVDNDSPDSRRDAYVGANKLLVGKEAAHQTLIHLLAQDIDVSQSEVLVILGQEYGDVSGASSNNYINGFQQVFLKSSMADGIKMAYTSAAPVEMIVESALMASNSNVDVNKKPLRAIVCTDPQDTIKTMNMLVEYNKVKDVVLIGSGRLPEIEAAITRRIIKASIVVDYLEMGKEAMNAFTSITTSTQGTSSAVTSAYKVIPIDVLEAGDL